MEKGKGEGVLGELRGEVGGGGGGLGHGRLGVVGSRGAGKTTLIEVFFFWNLNLNF